VNKFVLIFVYFLNQRAEQPEWRDYTDKSSDVYKFTLVACYDDALPNKYEYQAFF
jgi:hypothetical protein